MFIVPFYVEQPRRRATVPLRATRAQRAFACPYCGASIRSYRQAHIPCGVIL
jgi:hypothetical protein